MKLKDLYENLQLKKSDNSEEHRQYEIKKFDEIDCVYIAHNSSVSKISILPNNEYDVDEYMRITKQVVDKITNDGFKNTQLLLNLLLEHGHLFKYSQLTIDTLTMNYGGYSDWYIPSKEEYQKYRKIINQDKVITSTLKYRPHLTGNILLGLTYIGGLSLPKEGTVIYGNRNEGTIVLIRKK